MTRLRRPLVALVALTMALTACSVGVNEEKSSDTPKKDDSAKTEETTAPRFATEAARGVTDDTIKLGAAVIDVAKVKEQFGVDLGELPEEVIPALVKAQNDDGGINGRKVELVERRFIPVGTEDSEQICRQLIEDDGVFAVMGTFLDDNALCVTETYETPYFGLWGLTGERQERSKAPYITANGSVDDDLAEGVQMLIDDKKLDGKKVAVYFEGDVKADWVDKNIVGTLKDAGIDVVSQAQLPSSGDQVQADADATRILQRFEADGADTVLNLSGVKVLIPALVKQSYRPTLIFTNGQIVQNSDFVDINKDDPTVFKGSYAVLANANSDEVAADPDFKICLDKINANTDLKIRLDDIYPKEERPDSREMGQLPGLCQLWQLTVSVLEAAGDDPSPQSILDGLDKAELHITAAPGARLSATRWGAGQPVRYWNYNSTTGFFDADPL